MKIFVVGNANHYPNWIPKAEISSFEEADVVMFTGGEDVLPSIYHEPVHKATRYNGGRDATEVGHFVQALAHNKKMLGICRGSQLLTVLNGGKLIQDVTDHAIAGQHTFTSKFGNGCITSTHHQMMYPFNLPQDAYEIVGRSTDRRSKHYQNGNMQNIELPEKFVEPEIVWYPKTMSLCIQGHPERMSEKETGLQVCRKIFKHYIG